MSLLCDKCDHFVSQVTHMDLDDGSMMKVCNRCEIDLEDCKWALPRDAAAARASGYVLSRIADSEEE